MIRSLQLSSEALLLRTNDQHEKIEGINQRQMSQVLLLPFLSPPFAAFAAPTFLSSDMALLKVISFAACTLLLLLH